MRNVVDGWTAPGFTHRQELGQGACGRVVLAVDDESQTSVAIKYLNDDVRKNERFIQRYREDARKLFQLEDPNVVDLYQFMEEPDGSAVVMELVEGVSLARILAAQGPTGPLAALSVLAGTLLGLTAAHSARILHRDLKPAEILIDEEGNTRLSDFGLSPGDLPGSAGYLAPELWGGAPPSPAGDLYAATAVFFECLTGHRPFSGRNNSALAKAHREGPIPVDAVPGPLRELVAHGLAKDPARRPSSAGDFAVEMEEAARAAYGPAWEAQGRSRLMEMVAATSALPAPAPDRLRAADRSRGSGAFRTVSGSGKGGGGGRRGAMMAGVALLAVAGLGGAGAYVLTSSEGSPDPGPAPTNSAAPPPPSATPPAGVDAAQVAQRVSAGVTRRRTASFVYRGPGTGARGVLQTDSYDMSVWGAQASLRKPARAIVAGSVVYVRVGAAWRPVPVARATGAYAALTAQTRQGSSVRGVVALLRSSTSLRQEGAVYRGTAPLDRLTRTAVAGPLYTELAKLPGVEQVDFMIELDGAGLPAKVQITATPSNGKAQTYRTHYSKWGRKAAIKKPA